MSNSTDRSVVRETAFICERFVEGNDLYSYVNLVDVIAASRGWLALIAGQTMTVHYGNKEYEITRKK